MKKLVRFTLGLALTLLPALGLAGRASAQLPEKIPVLITVDEYGNGTIQGPIGPALPLTGGLAADTGPGGSASALTYLFSGPIDVVPGDVILREPGTRETISDLIRFNAASGLIVPLDSLPGDGLDSFAPASLVFYSDHGDGVDSLADQSDFPTDSYENQMTPDEVGSEGNNGAFYTPGENDPGYLFTPVFPVQIEAQYHFISDGVVPEPGSLALLATGGLPLLGMLRRRRLAGV